MQFGRNRTVLIEVPVHIDSVWTESVGFLDVHGRMDAVLAGLIAAGCHNSTLSRESSDHQRFAGKGRIIPYFDGSIKCVHIHMNDEHWLPPIEDYR